MGRKSQQRETKPAYAIITEDSASSPKYIDGLIKFLGGDVKNFAFLHKNSCPSGGQDVAKEFINKAIYTKIFCVFDKDSHNGKGKHGQINHYNDLKYYCSINKDIIIDASSVPSFEYWLYLHFKYHDAPIVREGKNSASDVVEKMLKKELPTYAKGSLNFDDFNGKDKNGKDKIQNAITNAQKSIDRYNSDNSDNPMTYMGKLYDRLIEIIK